MSARGKWGAVLIWLAAATTSASASVPFDAAAAFGARPSATNMRLSPDGQTVAYLVPTAGQGSAVYSLKRAPGSVPHAVLEADGKPERLDQCDWVSNTRLVCKVYANSASVTWGPLRLTRLIAVDSDGSNLKLLSTRQNQFSRGLQLGGGRVIDWLSNQNDAVLMTRIYLPDDHVGTRLGSSSQGLGVDRVDTQNLSIEHVEPPREDAIDYIGDSRGAVRIMGVRLMQSGSEQDTGVRRYLYRLRGSREWRPLCESNFSDGTGFYPVAIDPDLDVTYGFARNDGRLALFSLSLDGSMQQKLIYARPDVDVDQIMRIGRYNRVVGVSYATDYRRAIFFDPIIGGQVEAIAKALPPNSNIAIVDSNADESLLLVLASSDHDPGVYYLLDRKSHSLQTYLVVRDQLEGRVLATAVPIRYPASDGTMIPGYLTLPAGKESAKGLPAIVLPHGGPAARDEWGFDWLSQYFAARGFAVLQPNYRGSSGYGDTWLHGNGFRSWRISIGDVLDGGRWLVKTGIADPTKLAVVGWSYGGYAALQSAVVDASVFKAVVAIAPVTDLQMLKEEHRNWSDFNLVRDYIGDAENARAGSPALNAEKFKVPVLLFHGSLDNVVEIAQSKEMASKLQAAGVPYQLVTWDGLDHNLEDSAARAQMLRTSDAFLRKALGM